MAAGSASDASCAAQSADVSSQIVADLNVALNFTETTPAAVTFTVPDRTGDGSPDTIRYFWTGATAQASPAVPAYCVARQFNGGTPAVIASDVRQFNLNYLYRSTAPAAATTQIQMAAYDPASGTSNDWAVTVAENWALQVFTPSPPAGTTSWTLTNVRLYLAQRLHRRRRHQGADPHCQRQPTARRPRCWPRRAGRGEPERHLRLGRTCLFPCPAAPRRNRWRSS